MYIYQVDKKTGKVKIIEVRNKIKNNLYTKYFKSLNKALKYLRELPHSKKLNIGRR